MSATLDAPGAVFPQHGPVLIEDASACGLCLSSRMQLHPGEALVLRVPGHVLPLRADVVWRHEGPRSGWLAGCRLRPESIVQARLALPPLVPIQPRPFRARPVFIALGVIGVLALLVYAYLRFVQMLGGNWPVPY